MTIIPDEVANTLRRNVNMYTEEALAHAITRLYMMGGPNDLPAAVMLQDIMIQRGCEHMDTGAISTGKLVDAIDVIVRG